MKISLTLILFLLATCTFAQSSKEAAVWKKVDALNNAVFGTKDSVVIRSLVSKELTYGHSGGKVENMNEMVHNAAVSPTTYKNITTERLSTAFVKKTAIVRFIYRATSIEKGVESPLNSGILQVWAKEHGGWHLVARQAVKVNPK